MFKVIRPSSLPAQNPNLQKNRNGKHCIFTLLAAIASIALASSPVAAHAQNFHKFITFEVSGAQFTSPASINDRGEIAGWSSDTSYFFHPQAFVRDRCGKITSFAVPGATSTYDQFPQTINRFGDVVGNWNGPGVGISAFLRRNDGKIFAGNLPGTIDNSVFSINDRGEIYGAYGKANGSGGLFILDRFGSVQTFQVPGATTVLPQAINNQGTAIGSWAVGLDSTAYHGFLRYRDGTLISIDVSTATSTYTSSINDQGVIAGGWADASGNSHGFVRSSDGNITSFDVSGATNTSATSINDRGEIVGIWASGGSFNYHSFFRDSEGNITTFDGPGATLTAAAAINGKGDITGEYYDSANVLHGFVWLRGHHEADGSCQDGR